MATLFSSFSLGSSLFIIPKRKGNIFVPSYYELVGSCLTCFYFHFCFEKAWTSSETVLSLYANSYCPHITTPFTFCSHTTAPANRKLPLTSQRKKIKIYLYRINIISVIQSKFIIIFLYFFDIFFLSHFLIATSVKPRIPFESDACN